MINKLRKLIIIGMVSTSTLILTSVGASAEWKQDSKGWWYAEGNSYAKNNWKQIDGKWYYFDNNGYMLTNTNIGGYQIDNNGVWIQNTTTNTINNSNSNNINTNNINNGIIINGNVNIGNTTNNTSVIQQNNTTINNTSSNDVTNTKKTDLFPCWTIIDGKYYHIDKDENIDYDTTIDGYKIGADGAWVQDNSINPPNVVELPYGYKLQARQVIQKLQYQAKSDELRKESKEEKHKYRLQKIQELKDKIKDIDEHNYKNGEELKQKYENEIKEIELEDKNDYKE
jgi:hypothetical protein